MKATTKLEAILELIGTTWAPLPRLIRRAGELGWLWQDVSTPFVAWRGPRAISHVGVLTVPLRIAGEEHGWAGIHAVCTRPELRGRGHNRPLMEAALRYIDGHPHLRGAFLTTERPQLYERYGFQVKVEHHFAAPVPKGAGRGIPARKLTEGPEDVEYLRRALQRRLPLSDRLCTRDTGWLSGICEILYNGGIQHFYAIDALEAAVSFQRADEARRLDLIDVASPVPVDLEAICRHIPGDYQEVRLLFCPDRIAPHAVARQAVSPDGTRLLVRGSWPAEGSPFAMPPLNRC